MLSLALFTPNADTAYCIDQIVEESNQFSLVITGTRIPPIIEVFLSLKRFDPAVILLDLGKWNTNEPDDVAGIARHIHASDLRGVVIGFRASWNRLEEAEFNAAGIADLLPQPFSAVDLERIVYGALHRDHPVTNPNILAFLPAKAGAGCSVVTVNTAAAMANQLHQRVLLLEADRRSGPFAIMMNLEPHLGLSHALKNASSMTALTWLEQYVEAFSMHVLLAEPDHRQERGGLSRQDIEKALGHPIFATLPNDYRHVQDAIIESLPVASDSSFGVSCQALARKVGGLPKSSRIQSTFAILHKLRKLAS